MRPCDLTGGMSVTNDPAHESHGEPEGQKRPRSPYIGMGALIGIGAGIGVAFGAIAGSVAVGCPRRRRPSASRPAVETGSLLPGS